MLEFISNLIDEAGINISRFLNNGNSKIGKDIEQIKEELKEYDTSRIFDKILVSPPVEFLPSPDFNVPKLLSGLEFDAFKFESLYEPMKPFETEYGKYIELHQIKGELIKKPQNRNNSVIILLHRIFERSDDIYKMFLIPKLVNDYGYDVLIFHLPHHMDRQIKGSPFSGAYFLSGDPIMTIEAFRQSVTEVSQLARILEKEYSKLILAGIDIGGHIALYSTVIEDIFSKYILIQTGVNLNEYIGNMRISSFFEESSKNYSIKNDYEFVKLYRALNFNKYRPVIDSDKVVITAGKYDKIVPFWSVKNLEKIFSGAKTIYYDGGTFSINFIYNFIINQALDKAVKKRRND